MAFRLTCDNARCGRVLSEESEGQPNLHKRRRVFCESCAAFYEEVEAEVSEFVTIQAHRLAVDAEAKRDQLLAERSAPKRFDGEGGNRTPTAASSPSESPSPSFPPRIIVDQS